MLGHQLLEHAQRLVLRQQLVAVAQHHLHRRVPAALFRQVALRHALFLHTLAEDKPRPVRRLRYLRRHNGVSPLCVLFQLSSVHVQSSQQVGFASLLQLVFCQWLQPVWRAVHLLVLARQVDKPFGRNAALVEGHLYLFAERLLGLLDGLAHGYAYIDVYLPACRVFYAQHLVLPVATLLAVQLQRAADGTLHHLQVVDVHTRHIRKHLGQYVLLRPMVVAERTVVRTDEGQQVLLLLVATAYVGHHLSQPLLTEQMVYLLGGHGFSVATVILRRVARMLAVYG